MKKIILYVLITWIFVPVFAQRKESRDQIDKVSQLISAENFFAALAREKGIKHAFLSVSDENTIVFRPGPVQAQKFFKNEPDNPGILSWEPVYAKIAKSGDWGFTTGPYTYKASDTSLATYGDYFSVWKKNEKDVWKLALDLGIPHKKPVATPKLMFNNPVSEEFMHQYSDIRLKQREDIVFSSDQLYSTILNADNNIAYKEFLAENCRLLFPGHEAFIGKNAITAFWESQKLKLTTRPVKADRSYSGELAYTYGTAIIDQNGQNKLYHYVRLWEVQAGYEWKVILEIYNESDKL